MPCTRRAPKATTRLWRCSWRRAPLTLSNQTRCDRSHCCRTPCAPLHINLAALALILGPCALESQDHHTPLILAAAASSVQCVRLLLDKGAAVNKSTGAVRLSPAIRRMICFQAHLSAHECYHRCSSVLGRRHLSSARRHLPLPAVTGGHMQHARR